MTGKTSRGPHRNLALRNMGAHSELRATMWLLEQGYHVLRNVSQHGPVDIVAIKDGAVTLFDVKTRHSDNGITVRLTEEQINMGVKGLKVFPDGSCEIDHSPLPPYGTQPQACLTCSKLFQRRKSDQVYCGLECRPSFIERMKKCA